MIIGEPVLLRESTSALAHPPSLQKSGQFSIRFTPLRKLPTQGFLVFAAHLQFNNSFIYRAR
jgi:hypothetical protein